MGNSNDNKLISTAWLGVNVLNHLIDEGWLESHNERPYFMEQLRMGLINYELSR